MVLFLAFKSSDILGRGLAIAVVRSLSHHRAYLGPSRRWALRQEGVGPTSAPRTAFSPRRWAAGLLDRLITTAEIFSLTVWLHFFHAIYRYSQE